MPKKIHEMVPGGVDVSIDATGGEYGKGFVHKMELAAGMEQDTSEMINEAIYATRKFGRVGVIGDYVGCKWLGIPESVCHVLMKLRNSHQSFQHRRCYGTRYYPRRLRTSPGTEV